MFLYRVNYEIQNKCLCQLEMKALFGTEIIDQVFFSEVEIDPSVSPFIRDRLEILIKGNSLEQVIEAFDDDLIQSDEFKVHYLDLKIEDQYLKNKREICKSIGLQFKGYPSYKKPKLYFGIVNYNEVWYFGHLIHTKTDWRLHKKKPYNFSSSLDQTLAKSLTNIASKGNKNSKLIDPCCGVGTVVLEALYNRYNITASDINKKSVGMTNVNIDHFSYDLSASRSDISEIKMSYDAAIVDLPYNILNHANDENISNIIFHAHRIAKRQIIISSSDLSCMINDLNISIVDFCTVMKKRKHSFNRYVWVCE